MAIQMTRGTDAWVERISVQEMPALCATVKMLDKLSQDDNTSLSELGKAIMHDHGLTSRILRVSNSVTYNRSGVPVTTMSKAVVLLGFNALKQICITAKLVDSLLKSHDISQSVYERLLGLMAQSLHAAMLSKMMLKGYDDKTQEEAYIASLLFNLGECAFWGMGGPITQKLDEKLNQPGVDENEAIRELLGTSFDKISSALAAAWNMGPLLQVALKDPQRRTPEVQCIAEANHFSELSHTPGVKKAELDASIAEIASIMKVDIPEARKHIAQCAEDTKQLAYTYGALMLTPYLDNTAQPVQTRNTKAIEQKTPDEQIQLKMLRELTTLAYQKADINEIMQKVLAGIYDGVGMDRVVIMMLNRNKTQLLPRFTASIDKSPLKDIFIIELSANKPTIFEHTLKSHESVWVKSHTDQKWSHLLSVNTKTITSPRGFFMAPIEIDRQCIGLFYADRANGHQPLEDEAFFSFMHFVQQANLCLSLMMR